MKNIFFSLCMVFGLTACDSYTADYVLNDTAFCPGLDENDGGYVECTDKNGELITGRIVAYFDNGNISRSFRVKNGVLDGKAKVFYENGNCKKEMFFKNGEIHGNAKQWHESGKLEIEDIEKNGTTNRTVYREDGSIYLTMSFQNHQLNGVRKTYDVNGKIVEEIDYTDGKPGLVREYKDGKIVEVKETDQDNDVQTVHEYNEYGIKVRQLQYKLFEEINRIDTPQEEIKKQCEEYINLCQGDDFKKGCKIVLDVQGKIVTKIGHGIQLDGLANVIIKTGADYAVGDVYSTNNYLEYVGIRNYVSTHNMGTKIRVMEFQETDMPICK